MLATMDITSKGWVLFMAHLRELWKATWCVYLIILASDVAFVVIESAFNNGYLLGRVYDVLLWTNVFLSLGAFAYLSIVVAKILWHRLTKEKTRTSTVWQLFLPLFLVGFLTLLMMGIGFVMLIIPGIIFSVWFYFSGNALVIDGYRGRKGLSYSKALVRNRFWPIFGRIFLLTCVFGVFTFVALAPELIINYLFQLPEYPTFNYQLGIKLVATIISAFTSYFIYLFSAGADIVFYHHIKTTADEKLIAFSIE